jgi:hypothetical protein
MSIPNPSDNLLTHLDGCLHQAPFGAPIETGLAFSDEGELVASSLGNEPSLLSCLPHQSLLMAFPTIWV